MKERPILFSSPMVRAILYGCKTQTRRIIKPQPYESTDAMRDIPDTPFWYGAIRTKNDFGEAFYPNPEHGDWRWRCPYGVTGDRLWVRETFAIERNEGSDGCDEFAAPKDGRPVRHHAAINECDSDYDIYPRYRSTEDADLVCEHEKCNETGGPCQHPWRPSIFMPRWASRITLEITDVRVQRLQEIDYLDAYAEGIPEQRGNSSDGAWRVTEKFRELWDSINAKRAPWASNPWVWALTFRRVDA